MLLGGRLSTAKSIPSLALSIAAQSSDTEMDMGGLTGLAGLGVRILSSGYSSSLRSTVQTLESTKSRS